MCSPSSMELSLGPRAARSVAFARTEYGIVVLALAGIALHIVDDNYLQPQPGTSVGDHLASGLVPVAILVGVAFAYPHLPPVLRAVTAMTFGALGLAIGFPGFYYLQHGSASGADYTGLVSIAAGLVLLVSGPVTLWRARVRTEPGGGATSGGRSRRYSARSPVS